MWHVMPRRKMCWWSYDQTPKAFAFSSRTTAWALTTRPPWFAHRSVPLGLLGMQERAQLIGGGLEIESKPGRGTTGAVWLPLAAMDAAKAGQGGSENENRGGGGS